MLYFRYFNYEIKFDRIIMESFKKRKNSKQKASKNPKNLENTLL